MTDVDEFEIGIKSEELMEALSPWISSGNEAACTVIENFLMKYMNIAMTLMEVSVGAVSKISSVEDTVMALREEASNIRSMTDAEVSINRDSMIHAIEWSANMVDVAIGKNPYKDEAEF